jgi:hypothetical protein
MGTVVETTIHQMTMAQMQAISIDILSNSTSEVLKTFRLWFAVRAGQADPDYTVRMEPTEVVTAIRKMGDG